MDIHVSRLDNLNSYAVTEISSPDGKERALFENNQYHAGHKKAATNVPSLPEQCDNLLPKCS